MSVPQLLVLQPEQLQLSDGGQLALPVDLSLMITSGAVQVSSVPIT
jgi:hypothetical protein